MEQELRDSEDRFKNLFENAPLPYQSLDIEGNLLYVNQAWLDMVGCQPKDVIGQFFGDFMTESSKLLVTQTVSQFKKEGYVSSPLFELVRRDTGEKRLVTVNGRISRDAQGLFQHTHCILRDITEQYGLEEELKESEQRFRLLIERMPLALGLTNNRDELIFINDRFKNTFGYTLDDLPTIEHWWPLAYPDENYRQQVIATWTTAVENAARLGTDIEPLEYRITCKDGIERVILVSGINFAEGHIYTYIDITERKAAEEEIKQLAFFDPLTGLPNRRKLSDRLHYSIAINRRNHSQFAVFMMDLDKFKAVNDSLGHAAGDELLKQVAARIINCLRESDMVARLGGDEFVLVLENLKIPKAAEKIALKVIADLTLPFQLSNNHTVQIGASIGISIYPQDGNTSEKLMDHADTALYQAKDNGRGCFAYFSEVSSTINNV
jgi:diguanylate cyclase (GGDEF)-like protein/PAS domain S-box-containing protein